MFAALKRLSSLPFEATGCELHYISGPLLQYYKTSHFQNYTNEYLLSGQFCRLVFQGDTFLTYCWVTDYLQT